MLNSLLAVLIAGAAAAATSELKFEESDHCVAYRVEKTMFLFKSDMVVGRNCDVSAQVLPEVGGLNHVEVNVPVRSFNSGDSDRDKDVLKILLADQRPEITFRSKAFSEAEWHSFFSKDNFPLEGQLYIGPNAYPVTLTVKYTEKDAFAEVQGAARVRFADFQIKPPKVGGGLVAKSSSDFELLFHLVSQRILGADSLRLKTKEKQ